jgi:hypothetical protein
LSIDWFDVIAQMKFDTLKYVFSVNIDTLLMNSNVYWQSCKAKIVLVLIENIANERDYFCASSHYTKSFCFSSCHIVDIPEESQ